MKTLASNTDIPA